jgi:hypothetical protein
MSCCKIFTDKYEGVKKGCFENKISSCSEAGKKLSFSIKGANKAICKIDVRCLLKNVATQQCDFAFRRCTQNPEWHFVEMKGLKHDDAYNQIKATIQHFKNENLLKNEDSIYAYIVSKRVPKVDRSTKKLIKRFREEKLGNRLQKVNPGTQVSIS